MNIQDEWGPWIEHDGKGCPCVGKWVENVKMLSVKGGTCISQGFAGKSPWNWDWSMFGKVTPKGKIATKIILYRIRKPLGLTILETIARDTTTPIVKVNA